MKRGPLQTPYSDAPVPTPGGEPAGSATTGGFDLPGGAAKETRNQSGLPAQVTTVGVTGDSAGPGTQVPMPPVASPGTLHPGKAPNQGGR